MHNIMNKKFFFFLCYLLYYAYLRRMYTLNKMVLLIAGKKIVVHQVL